MKEKIENIIAQMTLEEKVLQIMQIAPGFCGSSRKEEDEYIQTGALGSLLHVLGKDTGYFYQLADKSRMKIPPVFGIDAIHGHALLKEATVFPSQLAAACSFNEDLLEKMGEVTGREVCADGLDWVFSPVLCLGRDLRWGRVDETFGEDAYLASRLGAAIIKGYQKDGQVAACAKHYLGYGEATGGRDSYDTEITERKAREVFLKPFKAAVDAGCMTFMTAYGSIDGTPLTVSRRYLTEILKEEYGFDGFVVTDWDNFRNVCQGQTVTETLEEACAEGLLAGNDMCMVSREFYDATVKAVKEGIVPESVVDNAVRRVLSVKERMGVLDGNRIRPSREVIGCERHAKINYALTVESCVLLKNDGILPLKTVKKIAVIGPNGDDGRAQYGDWTYYSHPDYKPNATIKDSTYTLLRGLQETYRDCEITYAKGCTVDGDEVGDEMFNEALAAAKNADIVVAAIGDTLAWNGEWRDAQPLLRGRQIELVEKIHAMGKPIIAVLINGKPLVLSSIVDCCNAIVETFNGGDLGGLATARLLKGEENFSGKLPISFPYAVGTEPNYYNQYDYWHGGRYKGIPAGSLYPFGFGLSYSKFVLSQPTLSKTQTKRGESVRLSVTVANESEVDGKETVQLYFRDKVCKVLTPVRQLCDFQKVAVPAGEKREVAFTVNVEDLGYYDKDCAYCVDEGEFILSVSADGVNFQSVVLTLVG